MPVEYTPIQRCRLCGNSDLRPIIDLGVQTLTGVFPATVDDKVSAGPLELVRCHPKNASQHCGLVQLRHSFCLSEMYGDNYGYRTSLNRSMVDHLRDKVASLTQKVSPRNNALVVDIGSNDGTLLSFYHAGGPTLVGIDPTAAKFKAYYRKEIQVIADFFSSTAIQQRFGNRQADIITSIAMFYDLEDPITFVKEIAAVLSPVGIWHFEQSYLPSMLATRSYDTVCHEHLEYYAIQQIQWVLERAGLKIVDIQLNDVNGGSFAVTAAHAEAPFECTRTALELIDRERQLDLNGSRPYLDFADQVTAHRTQLIRALAEIQSSGAKVLGYGASTKGNVLLQYCGITQEQIPAIAEVNSDKFGCITPGSHIPIISEAEAHAMNPDYFLVLPWHFRENLIHREMAYLRAGGKMIFPLPEIEVVSR
ncbi:MAG: class I SAM-dependent methyltransferase [Pirellulaceae bacterium]|nr:class I SAM-dependent methyltransferase [Pirellulaceae bacterium]